MPAEVEEPESRGGVMISLQDYTSYDGLGLAELVAGKQVKAEELAAAAAAAIEKVNPKLNGVLQTFSAQPGSARRRRQSSATTRRPRRRSTDRCGTRGTRREARAARAAGRERPSRPASFRLRTRTTAADRSAFPRRR